MDFTRNERELKERHGTAVKVIGLTGGIGSGKTVATDTLIKLGYSVIDADEISRAMFARGTNGERELIRLFPKAEKNGALDRAALRAMIAENKRERLRLNDYTHPIITDEIRSRIGTLSPPVVLSAPLLFESALSSLCDVIVGIYCPRELRINRITARDGISSEDASKIIDAQIPETERATLADYIVPSDVPINDFRNEITELFNSIVKGSRKI